MSQEIKGAKGVKMYNIQDELINPPTAEQFKDWMKDAFYNRPKEGNGRTIIVGKSAWMGGVKDLYQLTEEEALHKLNEAEAKDTDRLLHEFDPKTGFKKDIVRIYLIGKYSDK